MDEREDIREIRNLTFDLAIRGGHVVDGTGSPARLADIGIRQGKIVEIGALGENARETIDADGLIVAPGVIDVHTHYDAQVCWDGGLSSSSSHGVTTIVQGNCGIGVAPCRPEHRDVVMKDLVVLEGIPLHVLEAGIQWSFETFPEYLSFLRRRGLGVNVAALVPLSTLTRYTLGDESIRRAATSAERASMVVNLREAMKAGALGFSATLVPRHTGYMGNPLPCRLADDEELRAYGGVLRELGFGAIQVNVISSIAQPSDSELAIIELLLDASGRTVTYSGAMYRNDAPDAVEQMLRKVEPLRQRGAIPQTTISPIIVEVDFRTPMVFADTPPFKKVLNRSIEEQKSVYRDPQWRSELRAELACGGRLFSGAWKTAVVFQVTNPELRQYLNKSIIEIAKERRQDPLDVMLDIALEDDLELKLLGSVVNTSPEHMAGHIKDPRILFGLADAGAHVDMLFMGGFPTRMLGHWVREKNAITLEHAVKRMTSEAADYFGLSDRGRIQSGKAADVIVFDPKTVNSEERANRVVHDLPGGGKRLHADAVGMHYVVVNGNIVMRFGKPTGVMPGRIVNGMPMQ